MEVNNMRFLMGLDWCDRLDILKRRRGCFVDGGGQGGGGGSQGGGSGEGSGQGTDKPYAVFQNEASLRAYLESESKVQLERQAKEFGFETYQAMQEAAKTKKETDDASKSELEKEKAARQKAEGEKKAAFETANARLLNAEIKIAAASGGFVDPADAVALVDRSGLRVDEQGNVTGVKEAMEKLAKAKPHLLTGKSAGSPGSTGNAGRQEGAGETDVDRIRKMAEERNKGAQALTGGYDPWHKN
jgi:hypothetical protein